MFSRYRLLRFLGGPPPDMVSLARDESSGATMVLHMLPEALGVQLPCHLERLEPTIELLCEDPIPGIPQIIAYDLSSETPGFVEACVKGESLKDIIDQSKRSGLRLPYAAVAMTLNSLAKILTEAHEVKLFHGDLHAGKILIDKRQTSILGYPWSSFRPFDFDNCPDDTLSYLPPEALSGHSPDEAWDLYQLGLLAYQMYTGHRPFPELSGIEAARARAGKKIPDIAQSRQYFPEVLQKLIMATLISDPSKRLNSIKQFRRALKSFLKKAKKGELQLIRPVQKEKLPFIAKKSPRKIRKEIPALSEQKIKIKPKTEEKPSFKLSLPVAELILASLLFMISAFIILGSSKSSELPPRITILPAGIASKTRIK